MKKFDSLKTLTRTMQSFLVMMLVTLMAVGNVIGQTTYSHTITAKTWSELGTQSLNGVDWTASSTSTPASPYFGFNADKGQQFGSNGNPYADLTLTTSGISGTITSVKVNTSGNSSVVATLKVKVGDTYFTSGGEESVSITATATDYTFTGSAEGAISLEWEQPTSTLKALYLLSLEITYTPGEVAVAAPVLAPAGGTYYAAKNVTITCATEGANIYYSLDGTAPTTLYTGAIAVNETTTIKAIAVKGTDTSTVTSITYTFPVELANIAAFKDQTSTSTIYKINSDLTVIFQTTDKYHTFVQDESGAIYVYGTMDKAYNAGDVISGGLCGNYALFKQMNELKPVAGAPLADGVAGDVVKPIVVTIADLIANYDQYEGKLVTVENATVAEDYTFTTSSTGNGVSISQDTNSIKIYNTFKTVAMTLAANQTVSVTGLVIRYNNTIEIAPRSNEDIEIPFVEVPYTIDFDDATVPGFKLENGENTNKWFVGQAQGFDNNKLFISSTNGTTNKYNVTAASNVTATRGITIPTKGAVLSFTSRVNGEENADMLNVYLYNYTNDILNTEPTWQVSLVGENEWTEHTYPISAECAGNAQLVFEWVNNANGGEQFPAAIDNISVVEAACAQPIALNAAVEADAAEITWGLADTTQNAWIFEYKLEDHSEWYTINATTPSVTLSGLQGSSVYDMRVKANCGTESSEWTEGQFEVGCVNTIIVRADTTMTIGTGASTNQYVPFYYNWSFGYSQQIYTASELNATAGGTIKSIKIYVSSGSPNNAGNTRIWLGHTDKETFSDKTDYINPSNLSLVYVKEGTQTFTQGWNEFVFDTPFNYNGTDNIVVAYYEGYPNYGGSTSYGTSTATNMVLYQYSDGTGSSGGYTDPDHTYVNYEDPANSSTTYKYLNSNRNRVQFTINVPIIGCDDHLACEVPTNVTVKDITTEAATITWNGEADSYALEYKTGEEDWTAITVDDTLYTFSGLTQKTTYTVRVKALCGENDYSLYTEEVEFTTTSLCPVVTDIANSNLSTTTTITWTPGGEENDWIVRFKPVGATEWVELPRISGIPSTTFGGLLDQTDYMVEIMALCDVDDEENQSSWEPYTFTSGCAAFDLPYVEEFEATETPACWTSEDITFDGATAVAAEAGQWLMTPPINIPTDGNSYIVLDVQGSVNIQASYRGTALNRFAEIANVGNNEEMQHLIIQIPDEYKDKAVNFLFMANGEMTMETAEFTQCAFVPAELTAFDPSNTSIELSWNGINNNGWIVEYAEEGSEEWTSVNVDQTGDTVTYTLAGLNGATTYNVRVSTVCAGGSISQPSNVATATTHCDPISAPYTHFSSRQDADFECWNNNYSGTYVGNGARIASNNLSMYNYYNRTIDASTPNAFGNVYAVLPKFDTTLNVLQINFDYKQGTSNNNCKFQLGVVTDVNHPMETFRALNEYTAGSTFASTTYILNNATDGNLAFRLMKDTLTQEVLIHNIFVEYIPACQKPSNLVATPTSETTMDLTWSTIGIQRNWDIKYMKTQTAFDYENEGTLVTANIRPRTISNLEYGEYYTFYIRNHCSSTEQSVWVGPFTYQLVMNYNIANAAEITTCHGNVIFEADTAGTNTLVINPSSEGSWVTLNGNVQLGSATLNVYDGTEATGTPIATYTGSALVDVTPACANELTLKLANVGTTTPVLNVEINCADAPVCSAPSKPEFNMETNVLTWEAGCWGTPESYNIQMIDATSETTTTFTSATTSTNEVPAMPNDHVITFKVQAVCDGAEGDWSEESEEYVKFACGAPTNVTATFDERTQEATITWTPFMTTQRNFVVEYKLQNALTWVSANVNNATSYTTSALDEMQTYDIRVKAVCGDEESDFTATTLETPCVTIHEASGIITLGSGTTTNNFLPAYTLYNNTLSEQIYTSEEIGMSGTISSVAFYNGGTTKSPNIKLYLVHTDKTSFTSNTDWLTVVERDKVYEGDVTFNAGEWTTITFNTPFDYDGRSNLGLIVDENMTWSSGLSCLVYSSTSNCAMYVYSDGTDYNAVGATYSANNRLSVKNQVQFNITGIMCDPVVSCPAPSNITVSEADIDHAVVSWNRGDRENEWTVVYTLDDAEEVTVTATDTFITINGLEASSAYTLNISVYANCDETHQSEGVSETLNINTPPCSGGASVAFTGTGSSGYFPTYIYYKYSYTQQIFMANEINAPNGGQIESLSFELNSSNSITRNIDVYLMHTTSTSVSSGFLPLNNPTLVYSGNTLFSGVVTLEFNTPFEYNGRDNLVLIVDDNTGSWQSGFTFKTHTGPTGCSRYVYNDNTNYNPSSVSGGTASTIRNNISFTVCPPPACPTPTGFEFVNNTLTWTGSADSYTLQYREAGEEEFTTVTTTEASYSFTGLSANTTYEYQVQGDCGADGLSRMSALQSFRTPCEAFDMPFVEGFEANSPTLDCWTTVDADRDGYNWVLSSTQGNFTIHSGQDCYVSASWMSGVGALTPDNWLISPAININGAAQLSFWTVGQDADYAEEPFSVYVATTNTVAGFLATTPLLTSVGTEEYVENIVDLSAYDGQTIYIAFRHYDVTDKFYLNLDDVSVTVPPTCSTPSNLAFANDTLSWEAGNYGTPAGYNVRYRVQGEEAWTTATTTNNYYVMNIPEGVEYEVEVQTNCGGSDLSEWAATTIFKVHDCDLAVDMPFMEDFEPNSPTVNCWTVADLDGDGDTWFWASLNSGENYIMASSSDGAQVDNLLISPAINLTVPAILTFSVSSYYQDYLDHYSVYVTTSLTDLSSAAQLVDSVAAPAGFTQYSFDLNAFTGETVYLIFRHHDEDNGYVFLDDVSITAAPTCSTPMNVTYENDTLTWEAGIFGTPAGYTVRYREEGAEEWITLTVDTNFTTFSGLTPLSTYEVQVQANCGGTDVSEWSDAIEFVAPITCYVPTDFAVTDVTYNSAKVTWADEYNKGNYAVEYKAEGEETWTTVAGDTSLMVNLTNLNYLTTYTVRMKTLCGEGDESEYTDEITFSTLCAGGSEGEIEISGTTTSTSSALPLYAYFNYNYTQQIYTADEINMPNGGTINAFTLEVVSNSTTRNVDVYLMNTPETQVSEWLPIDDATLVYSGDLYLAPGDVTIEFSTPFEYNGVDNIALIVNDKTGSYISSSYAPTFRTHTAHTNSSRYVRNDGSSYNPSNVTGGTPVSVSDRDNISFRYVSCPPDNDLAIDSIGAIADGCDLSDANVTVKVTNKSFINTVNGFTLTYTLNGNEPVSETVNATILPSGSYVHTFAQHPAFVDGSNDIVVNVIYESDEVETNNTISLLDVRQVAPATVPYEQDFSNVVLGRDAWTQGTENDNPYLWTNNNGVMTFMDNDTMAAQNYFITHCIEIPEGQVQVSYDYNALSSLSESMNVYMGTTPDITTMTLIGSHTDFAKADEDYTYNYLFDNDNAGVYYFAVEATSQAGNMGITFDNLAIMPMIDVTVVAGPNGTVAPLGLVKVPYNGSLTIEIIPDNMYHTSGVWVDGERVMNEDQFNASFMMYTLSNIDTAHTINVEFKKEFHIFKYVYNYNDQYAEIGGQIVGQPIDTTNNTSNVAVQFTADEHYTLHSLMVGITESALIDGTDMIADVTYDEATRTYTYIFDTLYVSNYYVHACFKMDTVNIHYQVLTGAGVFDGVNVAAGETHDTWVDYGSDHTSTILPADGYYTMGVTVNALNAGIIDHYDFDSVITTQYVTAQFGHKVTASIHNFNDMNYLGSDEVRGTIEPDTQMVLSGSSCSVSGTVQEHFHLQSFLVNGVEMLADVDVDGNNYTFTIDSLVANTEIVATVQIDQVAIYYTVDAGNGFVNGNEMNAVAYDTLYIDYMSDFLSTFTAAAGYHIVNVTVNGVSYDEIPLWLTESITDPQYITITFALDEYDITTMAHGNGTVSEGLHVVYNPNSSYTFEATPAVGYHISQILRNNESLEITDPEATYTETIAPVLNNYDYVAYFEPNIYTVTASCGANGTIDPYGAQNYEYGSTPTFTVIPNEGYEIDEVLVDGEAVELTNGTYTFGAMTENHTITATFTRVNYTITATAGTHGTIDPSGATTVASGTMPMFTITPATGYEIEDVTVDGVSVGAVSTYTFEPVHADHTINATFSQINLVINAVAGANGAITPSGDVTVAYGASQAFTVTPDAGYEVDYVRVDGNVVTLTNNAYTFPNVTTNHTIYVAFKASTYTITVTDPANGNITPNGVVTVGYQATPTFTVTPNQGFEVTSIKVDGVDVMNNAVASVMGGYTYTFPAVTANHTFTATIQAKQFTITASAQANGSINPAGTAQVAYGSNSATYAITPNDGYVIEKVLVDGLNVGAVSAYTFFNVTADHQIVAYFKVEPCVVPTNLQVVNIDSTSATLTWYHPGADSYDIQYKKTTEATWTLVQNVPGFAYNLTNLQSNTTYVCKIKANTAGCTDTDWSNAVSFKTLAGPSSPIGVAEYVKEHVNVYAEHNRVHIINDYMVDINNVSIYDMYGKVVYSGNAINNPEVIELNVAVGTYVVRLNTEQGPAVYKVHINR